MGPVKVKIKFKTNSDVPIRKNLLEILNNHRVKVCGIFQKPNEFVISCVNADEAELIFSHDCYSALTGASYTPILPPELKTNRSVIIHKVDGDILSNDENSIKSELERCNSWCKVNEVIKFKSGKGMKIVFQSSISAQKSRDIGLSLFYLHIPAHKIKKDFFYNIRTCYVCYSIEEHTSIECPKKQMNQNYKICSNCAQTSHDFKTCTASPSNLKCINCLGKHSTMSMTCPIRRKIVSERRADINKEKNYASTVRSPAINNSILDNEILFKSITITILATLKDNESPGCFGEQLNNLLKVNNLPSICVDGYTPVTMNNLLNNKDGIVTHQASSIGARDLENVDAAASTHHSHMQHHETVGATAASSSSHHSQLKHQSNMQRREAEDRLLTSIFHDNDEASSIVPVSYVPSSHAKLKFYKAAHTRTASMEDILKAFREEKAFILENDDNILSTSTALNVLASNKQLPTFISIKKEEFISLRNTLHVPTKNL